MWAAFVISFYLTARWVCQDHNSQKCNLPVRAVQLEKDVIILFFCYLNFQTKKSLNCQVVRIRREAGNELVKKKAWQAACCSHSALWKEFSVRSHFLPAFCWVFSDVTWQVSRVSTGHTVQRWVDPNSHTCANTCMLTSLSASISAERAGCPSVFLNYKRMQRDVRWLVAARPSPSPDPAVSSWFPRSTRDKIPRKSTD